MTVGDLVKYDPRWILANARSRGARRPDRPMSFWTEMAPGRVVEIKNGDAIVEWDEYGHERHIHPLDGRLMCVDAEGRRLR